MPLSLKTELKLTPQMRQLGLRVGVGVLLLAAAAYLLAVQPYVEGRRLDREVAEQKARLERQQKLAPILAGLGAEAHNATVEALLPLKAEPIARAEAYLVTEQLGHMARAVGLEPLDVSLDASSMAQDPGSIQAQGVFSGELAQARAFLVELGRMASLSRVEKVELRAVDGRIEMFVQLRVALGA
ncbi:hypothetical protein SAMN04488503_1677 [Humidesulfovibrio mexicanus]|uniref:Uncharacterized protein n=1 Tax=Humidesulfovibrio mexicanus TaxID=147047 RepID=A0A238ZYL0_9BACT|nr:hypothetical protein [Humidesulfovibrio mexicanus]SNR87874.1 hypothetical protein SAMN04488503_1677 [Humidesulfovibrio mexicanus]